MTLNFKRKILYILVSCLSPLCIFAGCSFNENPNDLRHIAEWINSNLTPGNVKNAFSQYIKNNNITKDDEKDPFPGTWSGTTFTPDYVQTQEFVSSQNDDENFKQYFGWLNINIQGNYFNFTAWFKDEQPAGTPHPQKYFYSYFQVSLDDLSKKSNSLSLSPIYYPTDDAKGKMQKYGWIKDQDGIPKPNKWWKKVKNYF